VKLGSLALTEEHELNMFKENVLRGIFGSKRDETIGGWKKMHRKKEIHNLYSSPRPPGRPRHGLGIILKWTILK
jgi:hypothetical protein